jgi:Domain of unknown function (DUF222)
MRSDSGSDREEILAVYDEWEAINDKVAALSLDALTDTELLDLQGRREVVARRQPVVDHQVINRLAAEADPKALGAKNLADVLATRLDISTAEAKRRIKYAELLGPRQAITGEPLPPRLPHVAGAQARGQIGAEHLRVIEKFLAGLPSWVDCPTRDAAEADLARVATGLGPTQLRAAADRLALLIDQDGPPPHDAARARRRYLRIDTQGVDGMSRIHGLPDPEARATVDAVFAKLAAPGACNPDDDAPCVDGEPDQDTAQRDLRSQGQRNHDALTAMGRAVAAPHPGIGVRPTMSRAGPPMTGPPTSTSSPWPADRTTAWSNKAGPPENAKTAASNGFRRLDTGQARVNQYHHPEKYLLPEDDSTAD